MLTEASSSEHDPKAKWNLVWMKKFHQISLLFVVDKKEMSTPRIVSEKENTTSKKWSCGWKNALSAAESQILYE